MASLVPVQIKHAGKSHPIDLDLTAGGAAFKQLIYQKTGVEPGKQKVVVKGGMLKDDADLAKLGVKPNHTFMVIGTAGPLPEPPKEKTVFMEDMSDEQLAKALKSPAGMDNLGNTCYMNSTLQVLRQVPQLQDALSSFSAPQSPFNPKPYQLTSALSFLYNQLSSTTSSLPPHLFLQTLRDYAPQFAEQSRPKTAGNPLASMMGAGYAQQDAEECWGSIVGALKDTLPGTGGDGAKKFVDQWMSGELETTTKCAEAPNEEPTLSREPFMELKCNIGMSTNYMVNGLQESLKGEIEKTSPSLGRTAIYQQDTKISRLPGWLTVHLVRFYWRREIGKKAKIMRKVRFPFELDLLDSLTPSLREKIGPLNNKIKVVDKDRRERTKVRGKVKRRKEEEELEKRTMGEGSMTRKNDNRVDENQRKEQEEQMQIDDRLAGVDENEERKKEDEELRNLVSKDLFEGDLGCNYTGIYELVGLVTHKGANADGGHYVAWCRKDATSEKQNYDLDPDKQEWYCFDDEKVTTVQREKIMTLDGGGEDHTAYILLYRSKTI